MNIIIETDVKTTRKHRCRKCGRILKDGHLPEDENKNALEELEKQASGIKKTTKSNSKNKAKKKVKLPSNSPRSVGKKNEKEVL
jgi:hypothetical protein